MIPFLDLQKINARHRPQLTEAIVRVLDSGWYVLGDEVKAFEEEFAEYIGTNHSIGVSSGLAALELILEGYKELGQLSTGDEVIVPANTYIATIMAISRLGLTPLLVEPDPKTYNLCPNKILRALTPKTKAIFVVHLYGRISPMTSIKELCVANDLLLFEDCAQAHGAQLATQKAGSWGNASAFSFYPGKNLGALGDAGAITTSDEQLVEFLRAFRNYGSEKKYHNSHIGRNERLDELHAAILRVKLPYIEADNGIRRAIAYRYNEGLRGQTYLSIPNLPSQEKEHVWHLYTIRTRYRDALQAHFSQHGVQTLIHYPIPPHKQQAYKQFNHLQLPITESIHREILSLPISPVQSLETTDKIIRICLSFNPDN